MNVVVSIVKVLVNSSSCVKVVGCVIVIYVVLL